MIIKWQINSIGPVDGNSIDPSEIHQLLAFQLFNGVRKKDYFCDRAIKHCFAGGRARAQETATHIVLQFQAIRLMKGIGFSYY